LQVKEGSTPVLVGATSAHDTQPIDIPMPARDGDGASCWSSPPRRR
jgi:hypothetical protein